MIGIAYKSMEANNKFELKVKVAHCKDGRIERGLVLEETTPQNQAVILVARAGELKHAPNLGVGFPDVVYDHDLNHWKHEITENLKRDGQRISRLELDCSKLILEAHYIE